MVLIIFEKVPFLKRRSYGAGSCFIMRHLVKLNRVEGMNFANNR